MQATVRPRRRFLLTRTIPGLATLLLTACVAQYPPVPGAKWEPAHRRRVESVRAQVPDSGIAQPESAPSAKGEPAHRQDTGSERDEFPDSGVTIVIQKQRRVLTIMKDGVALGEFPVVMGRNGNGPKRFEGDMRTPEGVYRVTEKHPHSRWRYFIGISYPNEYDVAAYAQAIVDGRIPVIGGKFIGIGGAVGIHGSDHYAEQTAGKDWTMGCIALRSEDVGVVYEMVETGTPVLILP